MALQAYLDESFDEDGVFVLAGYVAPVDAWEVLAQEWEEMLPHGTLNANGRYHFKMKEMAQNPERMGRVPAFHKIIERHVLASVACTFRITDLKNAISRLYIPNSHIDWAVLGNLYNFAFFNLMRMMLTYPEVLRILMNRFDTIDFFFDERSESRAITAAWDTFTDTCTDEQRKWIGSRPQFRRDEDFVAIQSADFIAYWTRRALAEFPNNPDFAFKKLWENDFESWRGNKAYHMMMVPLDEDKIVRCLIEILRPLIPAGQIIYDVRFGPVPKRESMSEKNDVILGLRISEGDNRDDIVEKAKVWSQGQRPRRKR